MPIEIEIGYKAPKVFGLKPFLGGGLPGALHIRVSFAVTAGFRRH